MMIISADTQLSFRRDLVYTTYRDRLSDLVPYMTNVSSIQEKSRQETEGKIHCVNEWHGGATIPAALKVFLGEGMLSWTEYAVWDLSNFTLEWRIETHIFTKAFRCSGKNSFLDRDNTTIVENRGSLQIDSNQLQEVPFLLRNPVAKIAEEFLGKQIEPNLNQMSQCIERYLAQSTKF
jgi:hypothetical protein